MTDSLRLIGMAWGVKGQRRYRDLVQPKAPADERSAEEIGADIMARAGLHYNDE